MNLYSRPWAFWRRVQYGTGFLCVSALIGTGLYFLYGYEEPNCFDGMQNADERGVDCGGSCTRICALDITMPTALWAESFRVIEGQYNAVAYIENRNVDIGSPSLRYTFKLFDSEGLITSREGTTVLPPDATEYPIFEGRIMTGDRTPTKTTIEFTQDIAWLPGTVGREQFELERRELVNVDSKPELKAQMRNTSLDEARDVEIVATIFNSQGKPLTAARTVISNFPGRSVRDVVFTWPEPISKTLRSCEVPTDVMLAIDLSGSMNNDGGTPPEPITSVLTSAESFIARLKKNDQVGVVTYASNARLDAELTQDSSAVRDLVKNLRIDPTEERGNTNIGDALKQITEELSSSRHSDDARKVAILLTDGLATAPLNDPEVYAQSNADALKKMDIQLFTIGLGKDVKEDFLKGIASSEAQYYSAPSVSELEEIYSSITKDICEDGAAVIEVIPKAKTSFSDWSSVAP